MKVSAKELCIGEMQMVDTLQTHWDYHMRVAKIMQDIFGGVDCAPLEVQDVRKQLLLKHDAMMDGPQARLF